ncbi:hypothetical protein MIND_01060800 [Mycena indigotica]|uniref:Uncharacterized protein n=1 Tax=Mycena indigotica TaxID=2126181 RepID=A0A8H6S9B6_9AGAR|nr:uncharacterized protein MIND_01060800 [Mycena indigotica]KAF7295219.1 hypothetical protein MIND_01060800 [Mycena indigotica]
MRFILPFVTLALSLTAVSAVPIADRRAELSLVARAEDALVQSLMPEIEKIIEAELTSLVQDDDDDSDLERRGGVPANIGGALRNVASSVGSRLRTGLAAKLRRPTTAKATGRTRARDVSDEHDHDEDDEDDDEFFDFADDDDEDSDLARRGGVPANIGGALRNVASSVGQRLRTGLAAKLRRPGTAKATGRVTGTSRVAARDFDDEEHDHDEEVDFDDEELERRGGVPANIGGALRNVASSIAAKLKAGITNRLRGGARTGTGTAGRTGAATTGRTRV